MDIRSLFLWKRQRVLSFKGQEIFGKRDKRYSIVIVTEGYREGIKTAVSTTSNDKDSVKKEFDFKTAYAKEHFSSARGDLDIHTIYIFLLKHDMILESERIR